MIFLRQKVLLERGGGVGGEGCGGGRPLKGLTSPTAAASSGQFPSDSWPDCRAACVFIMDVCSELETALEGWRCGNHPPVVIWSTADKNPTEALFSHRPPYKQKHLETADRTTDDDFYCGHLIHSFIRPSISNTFWGSAGAPPRQVTLWTSCWLIAGKHPFLRSHSHSESSSPRVHVSG